MLWLLLVLGLILLLVFLLLDDTLDKTSGREYFSVCLEFTGCKILLDVFTGCKILLDVQLQSLQEFISTVFFFRYHCWDKPAESQELGSVLVDCAVLLSEVDKLLVHLTLRRIRKEVLVETVGELFPADRLG